MNTPFSHRRKWLVLVAVMRPILLGLACICLAAGKFWWFVGLALSAIALGPVLPLYKIWAGQEPRREAEGWSFFKMAAELFVLYWAVYQPAVTAVVAAIMNLFESGALWDWRLLVALLLFIIHSVRKNMQMVARITGTSPPAS